MTNTVADQMSIASRLNDGAVFSNHPSHNFVGIDGRCMDCDVRPYGRYAGEACVNAW